MPETATKDDVSFQSLLKKTMTMNPDYLCMAEVKGAEASRTIEAALTGHPVISTIHADESVNKKLKRLWR